MIYFPYYEPKIRVKNKQKIKLFEKLIHGRASRAVP